MKRFVKYPSIILLTTAVSLLSACGGNQKQMAGSQDYQGSATTADDGAAAYAIAKQASYKKTSAGFKINPLTAPANQTYYFSFNSSDVKSQDMKALMIQANYLATHSAAKIRLEGNTDNRGSREYNIGLGWRRDQSVARIFEQQGVRPSQIEMVSYGKQNPAVFSNNESSWALNRRVHLVYKK